MYTSSLSFLLLLSATACVSKPLRQQHRHDFDGHGIPDWCFTDDACTAHWVPSENRWTTFSATSGTTSSASISAPELSRSVTTSDAAWSTLATVAWSSTSSTTTTTTQWSASALGAISKTKSAPATSSFGTDPVPSTATAWSATVSSGSFITRSSSTTFSLTASGTISSTISSLSSTIVAWSSTVAATAPTPSSSSTNTPTGKLPTPSQFEADKGTKWSVSYIGNLQFTDKMASENLDGDKCRTGKIGDQIIWSCGDMECQGDWSVCGFSGGPGFYGTENVMVVDTTGVVSVEDNNFLVPWEGDGSPTAPQLTWGMDTSNVAPINDTHGVAFGFEIWRGAPDGSTVNRGNAVAAVTLGPTKPIATRVGPLLTGPDEIQLGLLAILRDGDYIYTYSMGGPSNIIVGRVPADDSVFDASQYEFLAYESSTDWVSGIPTHTTTSIGATTANSDGQFGCGSYGSVFFSEYLQQYVIVCDIFLSFVNMYISDTPYGPWSAEYQLMSHTQDAHVLGSYGSMVHPEYSNTNELYMSMGPNSVFNMFKIVFDY